MSAAPRLSILGSRGVPARHGGFETFAGRLAPYLVERGWRVRVYCQPDAPGGRLARDTWCGVERVHVPTRSRGALATVEFDLRSTLHAARSDDLKLVLGYNTAVCNLVYRVRRRRSVMNMDGIEWQRAKWSPPERWWLRANEWLGARTADHLVADHPGIVDHLRAVAPQAAITMIPYGADAIGAVPPDALAALGLAAGPYFVVVARIEPENSILEIVRAFSRRPLGARLVVLGTLDNDRNRYHAAVRAAAGAQCVFPGAIYDPDVVAALRHGALAYVHGHTVGGTNPSLVEALGAEAAVVAHDNHFNRWVAGDAADYFVDEDTCRAALERIAASAELRAVRRRASAARWREAFRWDDVLAAYRELLEAQWQRRAGRRG